MKPPEQLATTEQVADYLQVPAKTLVQWRYLETGPKYRKVGRHVRYDWAHVREWLATQPAGATA